MTQPTSDQLAPNVDPLVRDYIDAVVAEHITMVMQRDDIQHQQLISLAEHLAKRVAEMEQFERQVRSHLGVFIPE